MEGTRGGVCDSAAAVEEQFKVHSGWWTGLYVPVLEPLSLVLSLVVSQHLWVECNWTTSQSRLLVRDPDFPG